MMDKLKEENMSPLLEFFDKRLQNLQSPDPLEMGVRPPRKQQLADIAIVRGKIRATRRRIRKLLQRYWRKN